LLASAARGAGREQAEQDTYHAYWTASTDDPHRFQAWRATLAALTARQDDDALRAGFAPSPRAVRPISAPSPRALRPTSARGLRTLLRWLRVRCAHRTPVATPAAPSLLTLRRLDAHTVALDAPPPPVLRACLRHAWVTSGVGYGWWLLVTLPGGRVYLAHGTAPTDRAARAAGLAAWAVYLRTLEPRNE
jgi:hypothetical protein